MKTPTQENSHIALYILAMSGLVVLLSFIWQRNRVFNLWDEVFILDGIQRTHSLTHHFILENFDPIEVSQNPVYQIFKTRGER